MMYIYDLAEVNRPVASAPWREATAIYSHNYTIIKQGNRIVLVLVVRLLGKFIARTIVSKETVFKNEMLLPTCSYTHIRTVVTLAVTIRVTKVVLQHRNVPELG